MTLEPFVPAWAAALDEAEAPVMWGDTVIQNQDRAREKGIARRRQKAELRALVRTPAGLWRVMVEAPSEYSSYVILEILVMSRAEGWRSNGLLIVLGRAVEAGVNLAVTLGEAPKETRLWAAKNGPWALHGRRAPREP